MFYDSDPENSTGHFLYLINLVIDSYMLVNLIHTFDQYLLGMEHIKSFLQKLFLSV
jgi:hypothetical protein